MFPTIKQEIKPKPKPIIKQESAKVEGYTFQLSNPFLFSCDSSTVESYKCASCDFQTHIKVFLHRHSNIIHQKKYAESDSNTRLRYCKKCDFETYSGLLFLRHSVECKKKNSCKSTSLQCEICSFNTTNEKCFKKHLKKSHKFFKCSKCSFKSVHHWQVQKHNRLVKHNEKDQWYNCDICPFKSKNKACLRNHNSLHLNPDGVKWLECNYCSYKTTASMDLGRHVFNNHTDSRRINWRNCEELFGTKFKTYKKPPKVAKVLNLLFLENTEFYQKKM